MSRQMFVWRMAPGPSAGDPGENPLEIYMPHESIGRSVILSRDILIIQGLSTMCSMNCPIVA